jgi:hypothetical protein
MDCSSEALHSTHLGMTCQPPSAAQQRASAFEGAAPSAMTKIAEAYPAHIYI